MYRKLVLILAVLFMAFAGNACANGTSGGFDEIYMTDHYGGTDERSTFGWDDKPWLYLKLPAAGVAETNSTWTDPLGADSLTDENVSGLIEVWLGFDNWNEIRRAGLWHVNATYDFLYTSDPSGSGACTFTVTPEPVSSVLFLLGAGVLGAGLKKRSGKKLKNA